MNLLYCWAVTLRIVARYFLYRAGFGARPNFTDRWDEVQRVYRQVTGMDTRIRLVGLEHYPGGHPAVYAGNHTKLDDPFFVCYAVQEASNYTQRIRFVMRDDFFVGFPWDYLPFRMNEVAEMGGAYNISKDGVTLAQLRPLVDMLLEPDSFVIFPNGSRSRSGLWLEYRDGVEAPGSVAFFLAGAQRKNPDTPVPAVPVGRTYDPVQDVSTVMMGEPIYLPQKARREEQRACDDAIIGAISELVEVNVTHVVGGLLYLHCLHDRPRQLTVAALEESVGVVLVQLDPERRVTAALRDDRKGYIQSGLEYFARAGMLTVRGGSLTLDGRAILSSPPVDTRYRAANPVKYAVNQVLHLPDVVAALEAGAAFLTQSLAGSE